MRPQNKCLRSHFSAFGVNIQRLVAMIHQTMQEKPTKIMQKMTICTKNNKAKSFL